MIGPGSDKKQRYPGSKLSALIQALSGSDTMSYYAITIFKGWDMPPTIVALIYQVCNVSKIALILTNWIHPNHPTFSTLPSSDVLYFHHLSSRSQWVMSSPRLWCRGWTLDLSSLLRFLSVLVLRYRLVLGSHTVCVKWKSYLFVFLICCHHFTSWEWVSLSQCPVLSSPCPALSSEVKTTTIIWLQ